MRRRGKSIAITTVVLGLAVLGAAGIASKDRIVEQWFIYKLRHGDEEEHECGGEVRREVERRCGIDLRLPERFDDTDQRDERRVLLKADEVVQQRRDHAADRLREDHEPHRLPPR